MSPQRRTGIKAIAAAVFAVVAAVGVVVALVADSFSVADRFRGDDPPALPTVSTIPSASMSASDAGSGASDKPSRPERRTTSAASCLSTARDAIDCQLPHRYEFYDGTCDVGGLVGWLGGRSDIDVPRATVSPSGGSCLADFKVQVTGSGAQAFSRADSSAFRKCVNERDRSVVTCAEPHTAEYIAADSAGVADQDECGQAAARYLGVEISERSSELRVRAIASKPAAGVTARCVIEVVGTERLAESVRGVANSQLHWVP